MFAGAYSSNSPLYLQTGGVTRLMINDTTGEIFVYGDLNVSGTVYGDGSALSGVSGSGGSGESVSRTITMPGHTFTVGEVAYFNGTDYDEATSANGGMFIVSDVSGDDVTLTFSGAIAGLSGLTAGEFYYVHDSSAGTLTTTEGSYSNPVLLAVNSTDG